MASEDNNLHERLLSLENEVRNLKMGTSVTEQKPKKEKKEKKPRAQTEYNKFVSTYINEQKEKLKSHIEHHSLLNAKKIERKINTKFVYTSIDTRAVGDVTISLDIVSISGPAVKVQIYNGANYLVIAEQSYNTTGTKSFTFSPEGGCLFAIVGSVPNAGSGTDVTIDNVSAKYVPQNAIQKYRFYLPESVTETVTFTHAETDKIGMTDSGVTETYTGFSGANLVHQGRKYVEVTLERDASSAGFSQFTTTITANWTETELLDGVLNTISKESVIEKEFTARVS